MFGDLLFGASPIGALLGITPAVRAPVTHQLELPDGSVPRRADIAVRLVTTNDPFAVSEGFVPGYSIGGTSRPAIDSTGTWILNLEPNVSIYPAGTVYEVRERFGGLPWTALYIVVPTSGGRVEDLLVASPFA